MKYCAIDLGATSGRVFVGWKADRNWIIEEIHRFDSYLVDSDHGLIWDIHKIECELIVGLKKVKALGYSIASIGVDSWAVDYILLDQDDKPLFPVYAYRNQRSELGIDRVHKNIEIKDLYERTGIQFQPFNTIYQLASEPGERISTASTFLMIPDYFNFFLTGRKLNEYTNLSTTALLNPFTGILDQDLLNAISVKSTMFPTMLQPGSVIGNLRSEVVDTIGFNCKVLSVASHDTASAFFSQFENDSFILSSGTWSLIGLKIENPMINHASYTLNLTNEGGVNSSIRFLKNIMGLWIFNEIKRQHAMDEPHHELIEKVQDYPSDLIIDVNDDSLLAPSDMLEAVSQLIEDKYAKRLLSLYEILFVVFNSLADNYTTAMYEIERVVGRTYSNLVIVGGGNQNRLLNRLIEIKSGKKIVLGSTEATAIGNMLVQDMAIRSINLD